MTYERRPAGTQRDSPLLPYQSAAKGVSSGAQSKSTHISSRTSADDSRFAPPRLPPRADLSPIHVLWSASAGQARIVRGRYPDAKSPAKLDPEAESLFAQVLMLRLLLTGGRWRPTVPAPCSIFAG